MLRKMPVTIFIRAFYRMATNGERLLTRHPDLFLIVFIFCACLGLPLQTRAAKEVFFEACKKEHQSESSTDACDNKIVNTSTIGPLADQLNFMNELRTRVRSRLLRQKEYYANLAACGTNKNEGKFCEIEQKKVAQQIRTDWPLLRIAMALMRPIDIALDARSTESSWYHPNPSHPFRGALRPVALSQGEISIAKKTFLERLAIVEPLTSKRIYKDGTKLKILPESPQENPSIDAAMIQVRSSAQSDYFDILGKNPILVYITTLDPNNVNSPSTMQLHDAALKMQSEIQSEFEKMNLCSDIKINWDYAV
jgi:hypothetical protein